MPDVNKIARRPGEYLAETGIPQLTGGLGFSVLGGGTLLAIWSGNLIVVNWSVVLVCALVFWFVHRIKQRLVFPRGGYVVVERPRGNRILMAVFIGLSLALLVLALAGYSFHQFDSRMLWPGYAIVFAIILAWGGWKKNSSLTILFGAYFLVLAPLLWWEPMNNYGRGGTLQLAAGLPVAIFGALRLRKYLKSTPVAEPSDE